VSARECIARRRAGCFKSTQSHDAVSTLAAAGIAHAPGPALLHPNGWLLLKPFKYDVNWMSKSKLKKMFPGCKISIERFHLLPKSFIVTDR
jgi:hypothetical protein